MDGSEAGARLYPLSLVGEGERVCIKSCRHKDATVRQLSDLGLPVGSEVTVLTRHPRGPMVLARDGLRIALDQGVTHRIYVARGAAPGR